MSESIKYRREIIQAVEGLKIPCPNCKRMQNGKILVGLRNIWNEGPFDGCQEHQILMCNGCDTIFYGLSETFSEDEDFFVGEDGQQYSRRNQRLEYYPFSKKRSPPVWFSHQFESEHPALFELMNSLYSVFDQGHNIFAAMGIRTCFDVTAQTLNIDEIESFDQKIESLRKGGHISPREKKLLLQLVDIGSAAVHRSWKPNDEDIALMLDTLEGFIQRSIILPQVLDDLVERVPQRTKS